MQPTKFPLGRLAATPGALEAMEASGQTPDFFLARQLNEEALIHGDRILSAYRTLKGVKLWIITEADRSVTTALLPDEY